MIRKVNCAVLNQEAEGLEKPPFPGLLGKKIYETISKEAWELWVNHQTRLVNELRLNMLDPDAKEYVLRQMKKFLFGKLEEKTKMEWDYSDTKGPQQWGDLCEAFQICKIGKYQSPINIKDAVISEENKLEFHYEAAPMHIKLNHHSIYVHITENDPKEFVVFNGETFQQKQLHFHAPSEHFLEDNAFPMEVHLVHQNHEDKFLVSRP